MARVDWLLSQICIINATYLLHVTFGWLGYSRLAMAAASLPLDSVVIGSSSDCVVYHTSAQSQSDADHNNLAQATLKIPQATFQKH